jgi:hypothetical protein
VSDDVTDAGRPDPSDFAAEESAEEFAGELADLATAYPDLAAWVAAQPAPPMPADVWDRLEAALAEQEPLTTAGVTSIAGARAARRPRRLAPILGAAAGLVLVGAVGIPVVLGGNAANPPVADGPAVTEPAARDTAEPNAPADPGSADPITTSEPDEPDATTAPQPAPTSDGSGEQTPVTPTDEVMTVPARFLLASGTDYSADAMTPQVTSLLTTAGLGDGDDMATDVVAVHSSRPQGLPPLIGRAGFTADVAELRDCVGRLHASRGGDDVGLAMPALLVDRAQYEGSDAGVVVMLHTQPGDKPYLDVAIVKPECTDADVAAAVWFTYDLP